MGPRVPVTLSVDVMMTTVMRWIRSTARTWWLGSQTTFKDKLVSMGRTSAPISITSRLVIDRVCQTRSSRLFQVTYSDIPWLINKRCSTARVSSLGPGNSQKAILVAVPAMWINRNRPNSSEISSHLNTGLALLPRTWAMSLLYRGSVSLMSQESKGIV